MVAMKQYEGTKCQLIFQGVTALYICKWFSRMRDPSHNSFVHKIFGSLNTVTRSFATRSSQCLGVKTMSFQGFSGAAVYTLQLSVPLFRISTSFVLRDISSKPHQGSVFSGTNRGNVNPFFQRTRKIKARSGALKIHQQ